MVEIINKDIFNGVAGKRSGKPKGVVIHNDAGSKNATAKWYMTTFLPDRVKAKQSNLGFAHYYIDRNTIGRCENTNNKAWHVGQSDGNANYIGFEVCQSIGESEANFRLNEEMTFRQVAEDLQFYGLPANRDTVKLHKQFSSTSCPHRSVALHGDNTKVQDYFIARVKHYMSLGKTVAEMLKKDNQAVVSKPVATPVASKPATKSIDQLANEVIAGKHGSGDARKKALGSQFDAVQARVNQLLGAKAVVKTPTKTVQQLVTETLAGKHGNGDARKKSLGSNYNAVMNIINGKTVNKKSVDTVAREVIAGKFGNGADRKKNIEKAGYNYNEVQKRVNQLL